FSKELCGGTHVARTGDIGICKVVYEGSISAGVRRIEAVTGEGALERFRDAQKELDKLAGIDVQKLVAREKSLEHELQQLKNRIAQAQAGGLTPEEHNGVKILAKRVEGMDRAQLRTVIDSLRNKWPSFVVVLASGQGGDFSIVSGVSKDL